MLKLVKSDGTDISPSQSLSGWDGDFHVQDNTMEIVGRTVSQSLSGWDGDFHLGYIYPRARVWNEQSQSLSGWDGDFHRE